MTEIQDFLSPLKHVGHIGIMSPSSGAGRINFIQTLQIKYESNLKVEVITKILTELCPFLFGFWLNCGFRSIIFEGMQQLHSNLTEGQGIIKFMSSLNMEVLPSPLTPKVGSKVKYLNFAITQLSIFLLKFRMQT